MEEKKQIYADLSFANGVLTARLEGPNIGDREGQAIAGMIESHIEEQAWTIKAIVLDFSDVKFINSAGLGSCVVIRNNALRIKAEPVLFGLSKDIANAFRMCGFGKIFKIIENEKKLSKLGA